MFQIPFLGFPASGTMLNLTWWVCSVVNYIVLFVRMNLLCTCFMRAAPLLSWSCLVFFFSMSTIGGHSSRCITSSTVLLKSTVQLLDKTGVLSRNCTTLL